MTRWLSSLMAALRRDQPDRDYVTQMRSLWRVPPDWTHRTTAKVMSKRKGLAVVKSSQERKGAA